MAKAERTLLVTVVFMGDSITFGQYVDSRFRWTSILSSRLEQSYLHTPVHLLLLNKGVSGETTRMGLERFPADVQAHDPDVVTIQYGLNDCNCWLTDRGLPRVSEAAFRANLVEMIIRAKKFKAKQIILSGNHPTLRHKTMLSGERFEAANARYSEISRQVADQTGVIFCDIRSAFEPYSSDELEKLLLPYPDHLHLSVEGNRIYAEAIWPLLNDAVEAVINNDQLDEEVPS